MERAGKTRSTGQPVATGAGAIPARPRTPDPIHGGMRGKEMENQHYRFIDRLREAAREHGVVADLLEALDECLLVDGLGNKCVIGDEDELEWLEAAILAAKFVALDRAGPEVD